jgi:hypothetical protein
LSDSIVPIDPTLLGLINGSFGSGGIALPFVHEIFLMQSHIAGTSYCNLEEIEPVLTISDILIFKREPDNEYDNLAILIYDKSGNKLGYVPKSKNEVLARLMDAGKLLFGKLEEKTWVEDWLKLDIRVFMRDM